MVSVDGAGEAGKPHTQRDRNDRHMVGASVINSYTTLLIKDAVQAVWYWVGLGTRFCILSKQWNFLSHQSCHPVAQGHGIKLPLSLEHMVQNGSARSALGIRRSLQD